MKSKPASRSSKPTRPSKKKAPSPQPQAGFAVPLLFLCVISALALALCQARGWTLYYGDAEAHLNIARRVVDSRTPGFEQLGTVWLPLPHLLMVPLVHLSWQSGLGGAIASAFAYVLAGVFLYLLLQRLFGKSSAWVGMLAFGLNPNLLYLQSTPMTEPLMLACLLGTLFFSLRFRDTQSTANVLGAGVVALCGTFTRYEGWFVLPFVAVYFLVAAQSRRIYSASVFSVIAGLGPLAWLAHNWWYYGNPLEFYNGYWSARMIYQRALDAGGFRYPGDHDWAKAWLYYRTAVETMAGKPLFWIGAAGLIAALVRRGWWAVVYLTAVPVFYLLSMHSSGTPIFLPQLWPNSYYNSRYALAALPLLAVGLSALTWRWTAPALIIAVMVPWFAYPRPDSWICWKESQVNSVGRRAWTHDAATYLKARYKPGAGILMSFGDQAGILREAGIPLKEALHEGNGPRWEGAVQRPDLFLWEEWAIAIRGDKVAQAMARTKRKPRFELVRTWAYPNSPVIEIYRRLR